jgi:hypothetical protein
VLRLLIRGGAARLSLARTAELLKAHPQDDPGALPMDAADADFSDAIEDTPWGPARRLRPAMRVEGTPIRWDSPAATLGSARAEWLTAG